MQKIKSESEIISFNVRSGDDFQVAVRNGAMIASRSQSPRCVKKAENTDWRQVAEMRGSHNNRGRFGNRRVTIGISRRVRMKRLPACLKLEDGCGWLRCVGDVYKMSTRCLRDIYGDANCFGDVHPPTTIDIWACSGL